MDSYSNERMVRVESRRRQADLLRDSPRSSPTNPANASPGREWSREFAAWVVTRAKIGETFMARTPMNP